MAAIYTTEAEVLRTARAAADYRVQTGMIPIEDEVEHHLAILHRQAHALRAILGETTRAKLAAEIERDEAVADLRQALDRIARALAKMSERGVEPDVLMPQAEAILEGTA